MIEDIGQWCRTAFVAAKKDTHYKALVEFIDKEGYDYLHVIGSSDSGKSSLVKRAMLRHRFEGVEPKAGETWPDESLVGPLWEDVPLYRISVTEGTHRERYIWGDDLVKRILQSIGLEEESIKPDSFGHLASFLRSFRERKEKPVFLVEGGPENELFAEHLDDTLHKVLTNVSDRARGSAQPSSRKADKAPSEQRVDACKDLPKIVFEWWFSGREKQSIAEETAHTTSTTGLLPGSMEPIAKPNLDWRQATVSPTVRLWGCEAKRDVTVEGLEPKQAHELIGQVAGTTNPWVIQGLHDFSGGHLGCIVLVLDSVTSKGNINQNTKADTEREIERRVYHADSRGQITRSLDRLYKSLQIPDERPLAVKRHKFRAEGQCLLVQKGNEEEPQWIKLMEMREESYSNTQHTSRDDTLATLLVTLHEWLSQSKRFATPQDSNPFQNILQSGIYTGFCQFASKYQNRFETEPVKFTNEYLVDVITTEARSFLEEIQRATVGFLRNPEYVDFIELEPLWQDVGHLDENFQKLQQRFEGRQAGVAGQIVQTANMRGKLPELVTKMKQLDKGRSHE